MLRSGCSRRLSWYWARNDDNMSNTCPACHQVTRSICLESSSGSGHLAWLGNQCRRIRITSWTKQRLMNNSFLALQQNIFLILGAMVPNSNFLYHGWIPLELIWRWQQHSWDRKNRFRHHWVIRHEYKIITYDVYTFSLKFWHGIGNLGQNFDTCIVNRLLKEIGPLLQYNNSNSRGNWLLREHDWAL